LLRLRLHKWIIRVLLMERLSWEVAVLSLGLRGHLKLGLRDKLRLAVELIPILRKRWNLLRLLRLGLKW
jgi:hypothetical protein